MIDWRTDEDAWLKAHCNTLMQLEEIVIEHLIIPTHDAANTDSEPRLNHPTNGEHDTWLIAINLLQESQWNTDSQAYRLKINAVEKVRKKALKLQEVIAELDEDACRWIGWSRRHVVSEKGGEAFDLNLLCKQLNALDRNISDTFDRLPKRIPKSAYPPIGLLRECERYWENMGLRALNEKKPPEEIYTRSNWQELAAEFHRQNPYKFDPGIKSEKLSTDNPDEKSWRADTKFGQFVMPVFVAVGFEPGQAQTAHDHIWRKSRN